MRLQLRLFLIMILTLAAISGMLVLQHDFDLQRSQQILKSELAQRKSFFDATFESQQQPLKTLSQDYSFWDEMVAFVGKPDMKFARDNIDTGLETFGADAAWVYDPQGKLVYSSQADPELPVAEPSITSDSLAALQKSKLNDFYVRQGTGVVEMRGATIVPSDDPGHAKPPTGYWFVARRINDDYLKNLANLSQNSTKLGPSTASTADVAGGQSVSFATTLQDWNGKPVAVLRSTAKVSIVSDLNNLYKQQIILLSLVGLALLAIVSAMIWLWVLRPMRRITLSIVNQDPAMLDNLSRSRTEFGGLARTVQGFFAQKVAMQESAIRQADLERFNQEKSTFLKAAAHELKGPISIVKLLSEDLPKHSWMLGDQDKLASQLGIIMHQSNKMSTLINDLRLAGQGEGMNQMEYHPISFDFDAFLDTELTAIQFITNQKLEISGITAARCTADPDRMGQVVTNLIRNASKYSPGTETIQIRRYVEPGCIVIEIQDSGVGISPEDQAHIFDAYFRAPGVVDSFQGLGLGLSICKQIVEYSGGRISVVSSPGSGSTFTVRLPRVQE